MHDRLSDIVSLSTVAKKGETMGLFGGNQDAQERFYNMDPTRVYEGLKEMLGASQTFSLKNADDLSMSCTFSTGISMTTWGEKMNASVMPSGSGAKVTVSVAAKIGGNAMWQGSKNAKNLTRFFDALSESLRSM